jgi:FSR family fosmidomycin resistance protein-like MFS transporter
MTEKINPARILKGPGNITGFPYGQFLLPALAINHGLADFISGFILARIFLTATPGDTAMLLIIYNILGFGMQFPFGLWADKSGYSRSFLVLSLILLTTAFLLPGYHLAAVLLAGTGSCFFHVCGGKLSLNIMPGQAKSVGIFAAPGVFGLALGGYLGFRETWPVLPVLAVALLLLPFLVMPEPPGREKNTTEQTARLKIGAKEGLIILLLLAIALRSAIWDIYQIIHQGSYDRLLWIGLAACTGKAAGGFLADRAGWKAYTVAALLAASAFLAFSENSFVFLLAGIAFLQSVTGISVAAMAFLLPQRPATAAGLTLGLAIALGGIPFFLGLNGKGINSLFITITLFFALFFYQRILKLAPQ